jgi:hypothetical protein
MATSTVVVAGAAATGAAVFWPASAVARPTATATPAAASSVSSRQQQGGRSGLDAAGVRRLRLSVTEAQRSIAVTRARKAKARKIAAARAAARAAAQRAAQQQAAQQQSAQEPAVSSAPSGSPQQIAMAMLGSFGWSSSQFSCLDSLWSHESGWNVSAANPSSGAYGIPQALPGSKMATAGPEWQTNAATQIKWGLGYIRGSYGSPCGAWAHEESSGWY